MTATGAPAAATGRSRLATWLAGAVVAAMLALVWVLATSDSALTKAAESPLVGRPAPLIDAVALDGEQFRLDDHRGRWVVVNYFATWCVPCRVEHPELVKFDQRHRVTGDARVVSVVFDDEAGDVTRFFEREGGDWPVIIDDGRIALAYGVAGIPESYLVDPDGFIVAKLVGGVEADGLDALIATGEEQRRQRQRREGQ